MNYSNGFLSLRKLVFYVQFSGVNWEIKVPVSRSSYPAMDAFNKLQKDDLISQQIFNKSISNLLILRGEDVHQTDTSFFETPKL